MRPSAALIELLAYLSASIMLMISMTALHCQVHDISGGPTYANQFGTHISVVSFLKTASRMSLRQRRFSCDRAASIARTGRD